MLDRPGSARRRQAGGAIGMLLALCAIGVALYFLLRSGGAGPAPSGSAAGQALDCKPLLERYVRETGGAGPAAEAAYAGLPPACQRLMPAPQMLQPSAPRTDPDT